MGASYLKYGSHKVGPCFGKLLTCEYLSRGCLKYLPEAMSILFIIEGKLGESVFLLNPTIFSTLLCTSSSAQSLPRRIRFLRSSKNARSSLLSSLFLSFLSRISLSAIQSLSLPTFSNYLFMFVCLGFFTVISSLQFSLSFIFRLFKFVSELFVSIIYLLMSCVSLSANTIIDNLILFSQFKTLVID